MSQRNANDGQIESLLRTCTSVAWQVEIIKRTRDWTEEDFLCAIGHPNLELYAGKEEGDRLRKLFHDLLRERKEANARAVVEEVNKKRHDEISSRLDALKQPHWSIVPNFWITVAILILTLVVAVASVLALRR